MREVNLKENDFIEIARNDETLRSCTQRVKGLYNLLQKRMTRKQKTWGGGLSIFDYPSLAQLPLLLRRAWAVEKTLLNMPITIEKHDLIVGNTAKRGVIFRPLFPLIYTDQEKAEIEKVKGQAFSPSVGHKTPYYKGILEKGISGIIAEINDKIADIESHPDSMGGNEKLTFFQAMRIECEAVIALANRYAELAEELSAKANTPQRREELVEIAKVCRRVPEFPARTFHEAIQSFWFSHFALVCTQHGVSCGRIDQYLYPFLKRELDAGTITLKEAQELVDCLWLRFNDRLQICRENFVISGNDSKSEVEVNEAVKNGLLGMRTGSSLDDETHRPWKVGHRERFMIARDIADAINHFGSNILLSGILPDGSDGTNELTYLCLNATEKLAVTSPVLTVRLHKGSPPELIHRCAEVLKASGSMPYIDNDDTIIPAYIALGIPIEEARDYANSYCWETMIGGKTDQELIRGVNFLLFLELALNRGYSHVHGKLGPDTGDPRDFSNFQQLMDAWETQIDYQLEQSINFIGTHVTNGTLEHSGHGEYRHYPLLSALTLDCIEKERDVTRLGTRYTFWHVMAEAVANAIDSMAALKELVFEEKAVTMNEILMALEANWKGYENLRMRLFACPHKYANNDGYADEIGREMVSHFVERARFHAAKWYPDIIFPCSVGTFSWVVSIGKEVAATPDGRYYGDTIAPNFSPADGADIHGPTAAINSYLKTGVADMAAGAPIDLRLSKSNFNHEPGTKRLAGLIKAFIDQGGNIITFTLTDVEELKKAMQEPEKYRQLRVRMGGWSAFFVMLNKEQQLTQIKRAEHGLV